MQKKDLINLAKEYCKYYHKGQFRKRDNEQYYKHPFEVARILEKYGYSDTTTQCIALLHDVIEDSEMRIKEIQEVFGYEISNGVYVLSRNTIGLEKKKF